MGLGIIITRGKQAKPGLWILGVLLFFLTAACSTEAADRRSGSGFNGPTETRDDSFVVGASPRVVVSGGNGRVIVNPGTDGTVRVQATLRKPDDVEYETGGGIAAIGPQRKDGRYKWKQQRRLGS